MAHYGLFSMCDPALGRLDYASLSDQTLMEMLVDDMPDVYKSRYQDTNGNFTDISTWPRVQLQNDRVVQVEFTTRNIGDRQFPFELIPPLVEHFALYESAANGTVDTKILPRTLLRFDVTENKLYGELNFPAFPRGLKEIIICYNQFSGSCALQHLPDKLVRFDAMSNKFSGEVALNNLPSTLERLYLKRNNLSGQIAIDRLPAPMQFLDLGENKFYGDFRMMVFPPDLRCVSLDDNYELSGTAVLRRSTEEMHFELEIDWPKAIIDENGDEHPWKEEIVELSKHRYRCY